MYFDVYPVIMSADEGKKKARAAVQAMFDRYRLLASKRPDDHVVSGFVYYIAAMTDESQDFDNEVMNNMKIVDAGPEGSVEYQLFIAPGFSNLNSKTCAHCWRPKPDQSLSRRHAWRCGWRYL